MEHNKNSEPFPQNVLGDSAEQAGSVEVMELAGDPAGSENATQAVIQDEGFMEGIDRIPEKMAFKIGEVAEILGIQPYVLRYWESEFDELKPKKSSHNQR